LRIWLSAVAALGRPHLVAGREAEVDGAVDGAESAEPVRNGLAAGMGGAEIGNPPSKFRRAYDMVRSECGWHTMARAGEEGALIMCATRCIHCNAGEHQDS
jgi:adenosine deaminase